MNVTFTPGELLPGDRATTVAIMSDLDIITARQQGRSFVLQLGFSSPEATLVATAISELARNIVMHATRGEIVLRPLEQQGRSGVLVIARDEGPGISDRQRAALDVPSSSAVTGLGLRGTMRLVDEFEIVSTEGRGTTVAVKKWKA
ncbi:MAG: ATP-binding protein [Vicinamibacterales bacterium]